MIQSNIQFGSGRGLIHVAASKGNLVTARKRPKIVAPATIIKTRHEIRRVSTHDITNPFQVSFFLTIQMIKPTALLAAAASVAVTIPVKRATIIIRNRMTISIASGRALNLSFHVLLGPFGPQSGCRWQLYTTVAAIKIVRMALGMTFPKNSL